MGHSQKRSVAFLHVHIQNIKAALSELYLWITAVLYFTLLNQVSGKKLIIKFWVIYIWKQYDWPKLKWSNNRFIWLFAILFSQTWCWTLRAKSLLVFCIPAVNFDFDRYHITNILLFTKTSCQAMFHISMSYCELPFMSLQSHMQLICGTQHIVHSALFHARQVHCDHGCLSSKIS